VAEGSVQELPTPTGKTWREFQGGLPVRNTCMALLFFSQNNMHAIRRLTFVLLHDPKAEHSLLRRHRITFYNLVNRSGKHSLVAV
jgi:hypothetical protein